MSSCSDLDQARRRLTALLLASPLAGTVQSAQGPSTAVAAPDDASPLTGRRVHSFAAHGSPKYGPDFKHFDYVEPNAPKGGTLRLRNPDRRSSFDKYTLRAAMRPTARRLGAGRADDEVRPAGPLPPGGQRAGTYSKGRDMLATQCSMPSRSVWFAGR